MEFRPNSYYRHDDGSLLHTIVEVDTTQHGIELIGEFFSNMSCHIIIISKYIADRTKWTEITEDDHNNTWLSTSPATTNIMKDIDEYKRTKLRQLLANVSAEQYLSFNAMYKSIEDIKDAQIPCAIEHIIQTIDKAKMIKRKHAEHIGMEPKTQ